MPPTQQQLEKFTEAVLSLPFDTRRDVLSIAQRNTTGNPYRYLYNRVQQQDPNDGIYLLLSESGHEVLF